ncbi:ABC transporter permease [Arthrobacter sp. ISL-69]|uniref:ABC transporter permease n=1 Tax=Arthrobacter sp. ISL-69 TaxID=2819113 RepID=UPI001BEB5401|nr:ABC transporter permease [Arthrobacter sp. ISL-69]MBT2536264.1 ABC transporter permease [Arthrobacter sp. ISL-69]
MHELTQNRPLSAAAVVAHDGLAFAKADLQVLRRSPERLALASVQPVLILLFLVVLLGGSIEVPGQSYLEFLLPGVVLQSVLLLSATTAASVAFARQSGTLQRYRVLPISLSSYFLGRAVSECVITVLATGFLIITGVILGWRPHASPGQALLSVVIILMLSITSTLIGIAVGLLVSSTESAAQVAVLLTTPPAFLSTMMVTQEALPDWLQPIVHYNPVSTVLNLLRDALSGGKSLTVSHTWDAAYSTAWMLALVTLTVFLSTSKLRQMSTTVIGAN